jgi:hypothetical protein
MKWLHLAWCIVRGEAIESTQLEKTKRRGSRWNHSFEVQRSCVRTLSFEQAGAQRRFALMRVRSARR